MSDFKEILVLGLGRSGSNLLSSILRKVEGNAGFFEILFAGKAQGLDYHPGILKRVSRTLGAETEAQDDPAFVAARDADPVAFIDALSAAAQAEGHRSMSCKIFAKQITIAHLEAVLRRPGVRVIFLTRRRIDRHISDMKGGITRQYVKGDTTALRPRLDVRALLTRLFQQDEALDAMYRAVVDSGVPYGHLSYEADLDVDGALRIDRVGLALQHVGLDPVFASTDTEPWMVKQDQNADWRDKVENGFEAAAALSGLGLLNYAEQAPLAGNFPPLRSRSAKVAPPRDESLLDQGGYNFAFATDPVITFTAIQFGRSFLAEWMAGPDPVFGSRRGVHFLKPTWTMETTDLKPLADTIRRAEDCNPGHWFAALHVSDREAQKYREVGIRSLPGNPNLFCNEVHFSGTVEPHPQIPDTDAIYIARLATWKQHELAAGLTRPLFVYGDPVDDDERAQFGKLKGLFPAEGFVNHRLGGGTFHYLGRQELASVLARSGVALALSREEGCMRSSVESLLAGLPIVSVPSIGGRDQLFTPDTALIVEPTAEAVRAGVAEMLSRRLTRAEVRRATLDQVRESRVRFLEAANRLVAGNLGPSAPRLTMEPLLDFTIRYVPLRSMIETIG